LIILSVFLDKPLPDQAEILGIGSASLLATLGSGLLVNRALRGVEWVGPGEGPIGGGVAAEEAGSLGIGSSRSIVKIAGEIVPDHDLTRYRSFVREHPQISASAYLQDGELDISLRTYVKGADGSQIRVLGFEEKDQMQKIFDHFGSRADSVRVSFIQDNQASFNRLTGAGGLSPEEAARTMLAGKRIEQAGFTNLSVGRLEGEPGNYTKIELLWRR
jgi:hypothetical protein